MGYAFGSELDLQKRLETLDFLEGDDSEAVYFRREVRVGNIIPDLICVRFPQLPESNLRRTNWSFRHASLLSLLRRYRKLRVASLAKLTYERELRVRGLLEDLVRSGAVVEWSTGSYSLSKQLSSVQAEVIAVEAKLERWNEALQQAVTYQRFADRVFVAMDHERIKVKHVPIAEFMSSGVGLLSVSPTHTSQVNKGRKTRRISPEWEYLVSSPFTSRSQKLWFRR